jgi:excisionase family DNA binding protein
MNMDKKYISVKDAAELLGVSKNTVYRWIYKRKIKVLSMGMKYKKNIPIKEIEKYIQKGV